MTATDPSQPHTFHFTGFREIALPSGDEITSNDSGIIRLEQRGFSAFRTNVNFTDGTGSLNGADITIAA